MFGTPFSTQKLAIPAKKLSLGRFSLVMVACAKGHKRSHKSAGQENCLCKDTRVGRLFWATVCLRLTWRKDPPSTLSYSPSAVTSETREFYAKSDRKWGLTQGCNTSWAVDQYCRHCPRLLGQHGTAACGVSACLRAIFAHFSAQQRSLRSCGPVRAARATCPARPAPRATHEQRAAPCMCGPGMILL